TGNVVSIAVHPTIPTRAGRLIVEGVAPIDLATREDGALTGEFTVTSDGFYRIEMAAPDGRIVEASPRYTIDALEDQPIQVRVSEPGRDDNASPIEEVYFEVEGLDDFGVASLSLVYSVNGAPEVEVPLFQGSAAAGGGAAAGHTLCREGLDREPGDLVPYWGVGRDQRASGASQATSDVYFLTIRALGNEYRQADAPPGGGGGGGMNG